MNHSHQYVGSSEFLFRLIQGFYILNVRQLMLNNQIQSCQKIPQFRYYDFVRNKMVRGKIIKDLGNFSFGSNYSQRNDMYINCKICNRQSTIVNFILSPAASFQTSESPAFTS